MYVSELKESSQVRKLPHLVNEFLLQVPKSGATQELPTYARVFDVLPYDSSFLLESGRIEVEVAGKLVYFFEPGDFVTPPKNNNAADRPIFRCSQDVTVQPYSWADIKNQLQKDADALDAWTEYQSTFNQILIHALGHYSSHSKDPDSQYRVYEEGEVIIAQDEISDKVFTLIEGRAEAFQDGIKVGDIYEDEIFGAMAAFTGSKRTATVTAAEESTVRAIPQKDFVELVRLQPEICHTLIENMARQILDLNETILSMQVANTD